MNGLLNGTFSGRPLDGCDRPVWGFSRRVCPDPFPPSGLPGIPFSRKSFLPAPPDFAAEETPFPAVVLCRRSKTGAAVFACGSVFLTGSFFSGLLISKDVMSTLGIQLNVNGGWESLHHLTSDLSVILLGVHTALHWKWIVNAASRYILNPVRGLFGRRTVPQPLVPQPVRVEKEN